MIKEFRWWLAEKLAALAGVESELRTIWFMQGQEQAMGEIMLQDSMKKAFDKEEGK